METVKAPGWEARILAFGSRTYDNYSQAHAKLRELADTFFYEEEIILINGGAAGADTLCAKAAQAHGWTVITERAKWSTYGKAAGPMRNQKMIDDYDPDIGIGFVSGEYTPGSLDMANRLIKAGIMVVTFG